MGVVHRGSPSRRSGLTRQISGRAAGTRAIGTGSPTPRFGSGAAALLGGYRITAEVVEFSAGPGEPDSGDRIRVFPGELHGNAGPHRAHPALADRWASHCRLFGGRHTLYVPGLPAAVAGPASSTAIRRGSATTIRRAGPAGRADSATPAIASAFRRHRRAGAADRLRAARAARGPTATDRHVTADRVTSPRSGGGVGAAGAGRDVAQRRGRCWWLLAIQQSFCAVSWPTRRRHPASAAHRTAARGPTLLDHDGPANSARLSARCWPV